MKKALRYLIKMLFISSIMAVSASVSAQNYPTRPVHLIVPFPGGSATDTVARLIGSKMSDKLGQTVVVENVPGASGTIAAARTARAKPDGYTIMIHTTIALSAVLYDNLKYDTAKDFETLGMVNIGPYILVGRSDYEAKDGKQLLEMIKEKGGDITISNAGVGTGSHLCGVMLAQALGAKPNFIPYKSTNLALQDVMAGHVDLLCDQTTNAFQFLDNGKIQAYVTTSPKRHEAYPDIPTAQELGIPEVDMAVWHGFYAPKGVDAKIVTQINSALQYALDDAEIKKRLDEMGTYLFADEQRSPEAHKKYLLDEIKRFDALVKQANISLK